MNAAFVGILSVGQHTPADPDADPVVVRGPGAGLVRKARRVNRVLSAVRLFLAWAAAEGHVEQSVLALIYRVGDVRDLPTAARAEDGGLQFRLAARHRLPEEVTGVDRASDAEVIALVGACRSARDRLVVLLLARVGLRRGEAAGLRREDLHLLADSRSLGCPVQGSHLHVVRRDNVNGAWAKSRRSRAVPVDWLTVQAFDSYADQRHGCAPATGCDFVLVNLFRGVLGAPMQVDAIGELLEGLCRRAGLSRRVTPHMLRHCFASNIADAGGTLDEIQSLLGHVSPYSSAPYVHPSADRVRAAVDRVGTPRVEATSC